MTGVVFIITQMSGITSGPWSDGKYYRTDNGQCKPQTRIAFVKVHKAGSTTVMNILQRFGLKRNLTFVLPIKNHENYLSHHGTIVRSLLLPPHPNGSYDILCNHVVYNRTAFRKIMPHDTVYIGIVRQPFQRFLSAAMYNRINIPLYYLKNIPGGENYVHNLIVNSSLYEAKDPERSVTNNRMMLDFGFPVSQFDNAEESKLYIEELNKDFKLVILMEYMVESLILMKQILCWTTQDVIYIIRNAMGKKPNVKLTTTDINAHKIRKRRDYEIYDFFLSVFWEKVRKQGDYFIREVNKFREILYLISIFCKGKQTVPKLVINETDSNDQVIVTSDDCKFMLMGEIAFVDYIRDIHKKNLKTRRSQ